MTQWLKWRRVLGVVLVLAAILFLARSVLHDAEALRAASWDFAPFSFGASLLGQALVLISGMALWGFIVQLTNAEKVNWKVLWRVWSLSSFARYVPGKVWQFVATDALATRAGVARSTWVQTFAIHSGFSLVSGTMVGVVLLEGPLKWAALPLGLLVHPKVVREAVRRLAQVLKQTPLEWNVSPGQSAAVLTLSALTWVASGSSWFLFLKALGSSEVPWVLALSMHALSFVAGLVVLFAPAGLGVRETALTLSLAPLVGPGRAALIAAASRLWVIAAELISASLSLTQRQRGEGPPRAS